MRIDLLVSKRNELGLLSDTKFDSPISAVIFDEEKFTVFLEFGETMDSIECNIPISFDFLEAFEEAEEILIGVTNNKMITDAKAVPFGMVTMHPLRNILTLNEYERFWNRVDRAQPLHRDDFAESELASVTRGLRDSQLKFAKELKRELALQAAPHMAPGFSPQAPGLQNIPKPPSPSGVGTQPTHGMPPRRQQRPNTPPQNGKPDGSDEDQ